MKVKIRHAPSSLARKKFLWARTARQQANIFGVWDVHWGLLGCERACDEDWDPEFHSGGWQLQGVRTVTERGPLCGQNMRCAMRVHADVASQVATKAVVWYHARERSFPAGVFGHFIRLSMIHAR